MPSNQINIITVKWGDAFSADYVNILFDAIKRNTTKECKFICFTDNPSGIDDYIETRPLPEGTSGWWNKLYLFSKEAGLSDGAQNFFFDLDTLIIGNIDDYIGYSGDFMMLRDMYVPTEKASGIMSWRGQQDIWEKWLIGNKTQHYRGDQGIISDYVPNPDLAQDLYSGIVSYKQDGRERWPHGGDRIICFHGRPRPHEIKDSWVEKVWRKGGSFSLPTDNMTMNTSLDDVKENMIANCKLDLPWLQHHPTNNKTICIVGGAPSLKSSINKLKKKIALGAKVVSLNGSLKYLLECGITPDYHCQFDARPDNASFLDKAPDSTIYLIGSMSHPSVFSKLEGKTVVVWHGGFDLNEQLKILDYYQNKPIIVVGGGSTVGLRAMVIARHLGFRKMALFGIDSCFSDSAHHAYHQPLNDADGHFSVSVLDKSYRCATWMYRQALEFQDLFRELHRYNCKITAYGDGLIQDLCKHFNNSLQ